MGTGRVLVPCLIIHDSPGAEAPVLLECIPQSTVLTIQCTTSGPWIAGLIPIESSTIWDWVTYDGKTGYVTDAYVFTGHSAAVAGAC